MSSDDARLIQARTIDPNCTFKTDAVFGDLLTCASVAVAARVAEHLRGQGTYAYHAPRINGERVFFDVGRS